ncbi:LPXTG cell wall anchor domain-containing protein [Agromyces arachidis]|uniref:LPXTG cell wall anchor domain-containing protein n=1 Tax=Agromyces arachidis TaxID=766966 RepID=UPI0040569340
MKSSRVFAAALLLAGGAVAFSAPAYAEDLEVAAVAEEKVCDGLDSGKIDTTGDPESVVIEAPEGYVITGYCVKAGSANQGDGPEYFEVDPPVEELEIEHSSGKAVSHYSFSYEKKTTETTPPSTPPVTTHTTPPAGGGDGNGKELAETGFDNGWLLFAGLGAIALGGAIAAPRIAAAKRR